jgi:hypothetical protein
MNYAEEYVFWYLRLNGFFPITNLVIHKSSQIKYTSDCDVIGVRLPYVYEEIGGKPEDWDPVLRDLYEPGFTIGAICEVKSGDYDLKKIFQANNVEYSVGRLGFSKDFQKGSCQSLDSWF